MTPDEKPVVVRFKSQTLLGYQIDEEGNVRAKVFEGVAVFSDQSTRIIYGISTAEAPFLNWDLSSVQVKPAIDRNPLGLKIKK